MNVAVEFDQGDAIGFGIYFVAEIRDKISYQPKAIVLMFMKHRAIIYPIPDRFFKKPTI